MVWGLFFIVFLQASSAIHLVIPLSERDADKFSVKKIQSCTERFEEDWKILSITYIESKNSDLIDKLTFYGEVIFRARDKYLTMRRIVEYATLENGFFIKVVSIPHATDEDYERFIRIYSGHLSELVENIDTYYDFLDRLDKQFIKRIYKNIESRHYAPKVAKKSYGELDEVDDEPVSLRGNTDISVGEIRKEINLMMRVGRALLPDKNKPGPSGVSRKKQPTDKQMTELERLMELFGLECSRNQPNSGNG